MRDLPRGRKSGPLPLPFAIDLDGLAVAEVAVAAVVVVAVVVVAVVLAAVVVVAVDLDGLAN